jgi:NADH:ubiquinone oxidoreductase subunit 6 (subunit J)
MAVAHAFLALLAGFVTMGLLVALITALVNHLAPDWAGVESKPQPGYAFVNLGYSFLSAAAGGSVTAWLATGNPLVLVLVLGIVVLAMAALSALQLRGEQPVWYALTLLVLMPLGVLAGGMLRLRVLGIL